MIAHDKHERKLVSALSEVGYTLLGITPFKNADKFYFYKKVNGELYNIEIMYNGKGYCLKVGQDNAFKIIDLKYDLTWEQLIDKIVSFNTKGGK
jgi:hypothetical protein